jgi:fused signal recognition particle receptor
VLSQSLRKTRQAVFGRISTLLGASELSETTWDEIEELLIQADMGAKTSLVVVDTLRRRVRNEGFTSKSALLEALKGLLKDLFPARAAFNLNKLSGTLNVVLLVGVNGSGKTTSAAKLAHRLTTDGWKVMIAACDTFRAAAIGQLQVWGERLNIPVIAGQIGSDPGSVAFDAIQAALARNRSLLLIDTAGRLHTKFNLMEELKKVKGVVSKNVPGAPHEVWLVLDGTTGQNALAQVNQFRQAVGVSGVIVTKLDGTSKGGFVFAIEHDLALPVRFVGIGERIEDLVDFEPREFVDGLLADYPS